MQLLDAPESQKLFPPDVLKRAKEYLDATGSGGTGAYTHSQGVELCRQHVAKVTLLCVAVFVCCFAYGTAIMAAATKTHPMHEGPYA